MIDKRDRAGSPVLSGIFLLVGLYLTYSGITSLRFEHEGRNWIETRATVIECRVERRGAEDQELYIQYEYTVGTTRYTGTRISFSDRLERSGHEIQQLYQTFTPPGKPIKAYYHPDKPEQAVLIRGEFGRAFLFLFQAGLFFLRRSYISL
ncbi:DUF3592 domain-containing protein [Balneolaceae bacterium ANBcel3]|nr:DUF3592 domain-containing protein [Balneolaceae bacterium ANBcel3]